MNVIINGVNSDTINGLQILSLPPITKPRMRTSIATIDGRPGDIVTPLGYEAYNKTIKILLHDTYDLPAIMAYFNQSGTIIFSNDPDMVYTFETIDAINYERAVKFKTASVTIHVQPYKTSASEQPATGEGSSFMDSEPYLFRQTPDGADMEIDELVGGSVVFNQLCNAASVTVANGHKYFMKKGTAYSLGASTGTAITGLTSGSDMVIDLTLMFGSTIADYIYSVEQATAGAGVELAKKWAGIKGYIPYNAGTLKSVSNVSAHVMRDADDVVRATYPLDSSLTLRGIPKLDASNNLYYDGDIYESDGTVTRKYGVVDLGTLTWSVGGASFASNTFSSQSIPTKAYGNVNFVANGYTATDSPYLEMQDKTIRGNATGKRVYIRDTAYTDATAFKTAMSGVYLVYALETPTTETAEPYTALQTVYDGGTEEYVTDSIPVGHNTKYLVPIEMAVTNNGNTDSAPSITITGSGAIEMTVDGLIAFEISMPSTGQITIDSAAMDATDSDNNLANRSVSGDYNNLRLSPGSHTIIVNGDATSVSIRNASRWL